MPSSSTHEGKCINYYIMKIEKLPSGNFRVRHQIDGRRISVVLPYKPSKKEASALIDEKRTGKDKLKLSFDEAAKQYIDSRRNTVSPSTIRGYESLRKNIPDDFKNKCIGDITAWTVQQYINDLAEDHKPKTVRNHHGFISAVLRTFSPDTVLHTQLPQKIKKEVYLPSDDDVKSILDDVKDTEYEVPFRLACYGLRRSEICALTLDDLDGDRLTINKAVVKNESNEWIVKTTKTSSSTRKIVLDHALCAKIRAQERIYDGDPGKLWSMLRKTQIRLNLPPFPFHAFRHYYASTAHAMGMPDAVIMASGGWKTDHVMKNIYRHEKESQVDKMQRKYAAKFRDHI